MGGTVAISIVLAVAIFMVLPYYISVFFQRFITSQTLLALLEGVIRLTIFIGYVAAISLMPDIKRVYMYHGAEHKCINCIEQGMDLTVENVRKSSRLHKRCGTSFLLIVMLISIVFFLFIRVDNPDPAASAAPGVNSGDCGGIVRVYPACRTLGSYACQSVQQAGASAAADYDKRAG